MTFPQGRRLVVAAALGAALLASACAPFRDRQGYVVDDVLVAAIQPGVDNRESVENTLGRPTFVGQFDQRDWYYVSRETKQSAFSMPRPSEQTILHIRFDDAGNVAAVSRSGLEQVASIEPSGERTPTIGRSRGFFRELFGNVGAAGPTGARPTGTADNPQ